MKKNKTIYEVESPSYMMLNDKKVYVGQDVSFVPASNKKEAQDIYNKKYSKPTKVKHYTGMKDYIIDTNKSIYTRKDDYKEIFTNAKFK